MQPYFLPYIGYFQLINAADTFVYYDDVTFIKQSWINRNRILLNGEDYLFTLELKGASSFKEINKVEVGSNRNKLFKTIIQAYRQAPYFRVIEPFLATIFTSNQENLSKYIIETNKLIIDYLSIKTNILISSEIIKDKSLKGHLKIIDICKNLQATHYINAIGGKDLYSKSEFKNSGILLSFIKSREIRYMQFSENFIPWLSIIDVLMFNSVNDIKKMLVNFEFI